MEKGGEVQLKIEETVLGSQDVAQDITSRARLSESIEKVAVDLLGIPKTGSKATKEDEVERQLDTEANKNRGQSPVTMETDLTKPGLESSNQAPPDGPLGQDKSCEEAQEPKTVAKVVSKVSQAKENSRDMKPLQVTQDTGTIAQNAPSNSKLIAKGVLATRKRKKGAKSVAKGGDEQLVGSSSADTAASRLSDGALVDEAKSKGNTANKKTPPEVDEPKDKNGEEPRGPGPFFYIGGANGAGLVSLYCRSKGWQRIHDNKREDYKLKWCKTKSRETYYNFKEGEQLLYQIPNNKVLTTKIGLLSNLREYERVMNKISKNLNLRFSQKILKMEDFFPESFRLDIKDEREAFFELYKDTQIWICKPTSSNQGRGIFLLKNQAGVKSLQARLQSIEEDPLYKKVPYKAPQARIVQRYIQKPLLLEGKKFDVRSYLLIACTVPYVLFFGHGYVRLTCTRYDATSDDLTAHLTNQYMQKKNPLYSQLKEETVWQMEHFNSYVNDKFKQAKGLPKDWVLTVFTKRMQQIMIQCFLAVKSKLECKLGYFDLIGCDFLIDEDFKVWLLEMNANPALHTNCSVLQDVIPTVVNETLDLVLEIFHKLLKGQRILPLQKLCHFVLLHNGSAPEPGAKASKTRNSVGLTRSQRSLLESSSHFVQHPSKAAEKSPKKPSGSGETTISTPQRVSQRTVLTMPQVQITDIHRSYAYHPFKPPVQSGQVSRTCSQYIIKPVLFSEESSLAKPSTDDGSGKDMANAINSTAAASKENTYSVWLQQTFRIKSPTSTKEDLAFTSSQKVSLHLQSKVSDGSPCLEDHPKSFCRLLTHPMAKETPLTIDSKALAASQYAEPPPDHQKKVSRRGS